MLNPQTLTWLGPTGIAVLTALMALYVTFKWIVPRVRKIFNLVDDMFGEPARPGVPARPGIMERLEDTTIRLSELECRTKELVPNHGSSIKDTVNRIEDSLDSLHNRVERIEGWATNTDARLELGKAKIEALEKRTA